jgi:hypothetical protein
LHESPNLRHLTHTELTLASARLTELFVATPVELAALLEQLSAPTKCSAKMAPLLPYTYIQCSCSDQLPADAGTGWPTEQLDEDDERTFDPRAPRSNYSLYPLEYLLYCEDCQQIRCPKCVAEETVTYFCPNCLFEVPSSNLRSEGNRYECNARLGMMPGLQELLQMHTKLLPMSSMHWSPPSSCPTRGIRQ